MNNTQVNNMQAARPGQYGNPAPMSSSTTTSASAHNRATNTSEAAGGDQFDDLFSFAGLTNTKSNTNSSGMGQPKMSMAAMAREQSSASIWGASSNNAALKQPASMGAPMGSAAPSSTLGNNNDDLLL